MGGAWADCGTDSMAMTEISSPAASRCGPPKPGSRIRIGEVELEVVRVAAPCRILDDGIAPGAAAALRRRGGSICRVLGGGSIRVGDPVEVTDSVTPAHP